MKYVIFRLERLFLVTLYKTSCIIQFQGIFHIISDLNTNMISRKVICLSDLILILKKCFFSLLKSPFTRFIGKKD